MLQNKSNNSDDPARELMRNKAALRKANRFFNIASIIYVGTCLIYAAITFFIIILFVSESFFDTFFMFLDGIVLRAIILYFGYQCCYKHDNKFAMLLLVVQAADFGVMSLLSAAGVCGFYGGVSIFFNLTFLGLYTFLSILIVPYNKEYQYLEKQEGFPYFNERVEEVEKKRQEFETANPFVLRKKELEKNSSKDMDYLDYSMRSGDNGCDDLTGKGTMDEI